MLFGNTFLTICLRGSFVVSACLVFATSYGQDSTRDRSYSELKRATETAIEQRDVPGIAIAVIRHGEVDWMHGSGLADVESKKPVTEDTVFNVGSVSKCVAAWGIMQLVESGQVELDAPISKSVTKWTLPPSNFGAEGVTLRRILSHTAGLSLHGYPGFSQREKLPTLERSLSGETNGGGAVRIANEPGSKWQYSGGGYTLAQLLLEEKTGQDFACYMKEKVFKPLGMTSSDYRWTPEILRDSATPYDAKGHAIEPRRFTARAAAGLQTSVSDLARFGVASLAQDDESTGGVLSPKTVELMREFVPPKGETSARWYWMTLLDPFAFKAKQAASGLGYQHMEFAQFDAIGHTGSNAGWEAALILCPSTGDGLVVLTNSSNGKRAIERVFRAWVQIMMAQASDK
jgi:CubicO group peptidase (beta-lactamase class C family)